MGVCWARRNLAEAIPCFKTLEQWREKKSTKFDICARMSQHILARDDAPEMVFREGTVIFPTIPEPQPGQTIGQNTKILIFSDFPSLGPLVRNVRL